MTSWSSRQKAGLGTAWTTTRPQDCLAVNNNEKSKRKRVHICLRKIRSRILGLGGAAFAGFAP